MVIAIWEIQISRTSRWIFIKSENVAITATYFLKLSFGISIAFDAEKLAFIPTRKQTSLLKMLVRRNKDCCAWSITTWEVFE